MGAGHREGLHPVFTPSRLRKRTEEGSAALSRAAEAWELTAGAGEAGAPRVTLQKHAVISV